jgi:site-specific DNA-methyltransferase (adenine-specific)
MIAGVIGVRVVQQSLLDWKPDMKFDVIVGNPPYQDGKDQYFYKGFVEKSFNLTDGVVAMITSANWVSGTGKSKKFFKQIQEKRITHYRYLGTKAFDVQILTAYFICQPNTNTTTVEIITDKGAVTVNRSDFGIVSSGVTDTLDIVSKVKSHSKNKFINFSAGDMARDKAVVAPIGTKAIFGCGFEGKDFDWRYVSNPEKLAGIGKHKVVFSKNSSIGNIGPIKYADPSFGCAANAYFIEVTDEFEAENLIAYLKSKPIKISVKTLKHASCTNSKGLMNQLPMIDISRRCTDAELYAHFGLTQEEIDYIEATIK